MSVIARESGDPVTSGTSIEMRVSGLLDAPLWRGMTPKWNGLSESQHQIELTPSAQPGRSAMIKDLLVNLTVGTDGDPAARFAISIAATFEAHIAGIAFAYDPAITPTVMDGLSASWVDALRAENRAAAQEAVDRFEAAARREGLSAEHRIIDASLGRAATVFGRMARRFDLAVVGQTDPERALPDDLLIEAALFESGRPVVVVPYIQTEDLKLGHVLVCWDGSRNAARAIADSMPFLTRGKKVEIVMVASGDGKAHELPGAELRH